MNVNEEMLADLRIITHDSRLNISKTEFNTDYGFRSIPVILKNTFQYLEIKEKWSKKYLIEKLPSREIIASSLDSTKSLAMTIGEYFDYRDPTYYYKKTLEPTSTLLNDFSELSIFNCWYKQTYLENQKTPLTWLYAGVKQSFSEIHRDIWWTSAWNYLISGLKLWLIYPSEYNKYIASHKDSFRFYTNSENLSLFVKKANYKPMFCLQKAGDLVYVPGNCYHSVINLEDSISLTSNFINETNYDRVRDYFRTMKNRKNQATIEKIVKIGFEKCLV